MKVNCNTLIIDDDNISCFLAKNVFRQLGNNVKIRTLANGKEAVDFFKSSQNGYPDLVLLDINMPLMNGFEFLDWYEANHLQGSSKFTIYTSSEREKDMEKAFAYRDVIDYITKPVTKDKIAKLMSQVRNGVELNTE